MSAAANETNDTPPGAPKRRVWWLYTRVLVVQAVALILLWLLQSTYGS